MITKNINSTSGKKYEEITVPGIVYDDEPIEGSFNGITSDAVAKATSGGSGGTPVKDLIPEGASEENKLATAADVAGVQEDVDTIEGKIPSDTSTTNKLVNESGLQDAIDNASESWSTGFTPKGESSVSDLNGLTTQSNGDSYIVTDSGTITDGSLAVVAGDQVAWDATNSVWYKLPQYALNQFGTNTIKDLATTKYKGFMALDDADGTGKMDVTNIFNNFVPEFDPTRTSENPYKVGESVIYNGKTYTFRYNHYGPWAYGDVNLTNEETRSKLSKERGATDSIRLSKLENFIYDETGTKQYENIAFEQGGFFGDGVLGDISSRIRSTSLIPVSKGDYVEFSMDEAGYGVFLYVIDANLKVLSNSQIAFYVNDESAAYLFIVMFNSTDRTLPITPSEGSSAGLTISIQCHIDSSIRGSTFFNAAQIFDKCICIGDSLTAGYSTYGGVTIGSQTAVKLPFNWPSYMARRTGCSYKNMGIGGSTTHHWRYSDGPTETYIADITLANEFANAYFIGLGANDKRGNFTIGLSSDIKINKDENSNTFYGNYDWIVRTLHGYNPNAVIFVMTMATLEGDGAEAYNTAIRQIAALYDYVILIDLWADTRYKSTAIMNLYYGGHLNPLGYNLAASIIYDNLCKAIVGNESKFMLLPLFNGYPVPN